MLKRCQQAGQSEKALRLYDRVLAENPHQIDSILNKGNILFSLRRFDEALACHEQALSLASVRKEIIHRCIAAVHCTTGRFDDGIRHYRLAIELNRRYGPAWLGLVQALVQAGRPADAKESCGQFVLNCTVEDASLLDEARDIVARHA